MVKKALITGTSCGVGRAAALKFLSMGIEVYGIDIKEPTIVHTFYHHINCDVRDKENLPELSGC